jgi:hypothetical protein
MAKEQSIERGTDQFYETRYHQKAKNIMASFIGKIA